MNEWTQGIIGAAIEIHRSLGPGLLESAYEECLCHELFVRKLPFERQVSLPVQYKQVRLDCGYRADIVVAKTILIELKSVECLQAVHEAQVLTYLRLGLFPVGLLINFNVKYLKDGIIRKIIDIE